ncbi:NAD(P)/FAD-dependent oxidoreductase, partial [Enorma massiliensis]
STSITAVDGDRFLSSITFRNNDTGEVHTEAFEEGSFGIFVFAGTDPVVELVRPFVDLGSDGGVMTNESMETPTPGLYCVGDMRSKRLRQAITAAADGAIAGSEAYRYVTERG